MSVRSAGRGPSVSGVAVAGAVLVAGAALLSSCAVGPGVADPTPEPRPHRTRVEPGGPPTGAGARQVPGGPQDPTALPARRVDQALLAASLYDLDGTTSLVVVDAADGAWVRSDVPVSPAVPLQLAPDGRSFLQSSWETDEGHSVVEVVELGTGTVRPVPLGLSQDCLVDAVAWAPDSVHLAVVSVCSAPQVYPVEPTVWTLVEEVEVATGAARLVERVLDAVPVETYPSYSPDGRLLAYGIVHPAPRADEDDEWVSVRVVGTHGDGDPHEWPMTHVVYGDPWRDDTTLLAWDKAASVTGPDSHVLLSATDGSAVPYGIEGLANLDGFVGGRLLAEQWDAVGTAPACAAALCAVDLDTHAVEPWLTLPAGLRVQFVSPARALLDR